MLRRKEITSLMINTIFAKILLVFPRTYIINSGNAAWLQMLINAVIVLIVFFITFSVYKEKKNIIEIAAEKGGNWFKIPVGTLLFLILATNFVSVIRIFPETINIVLLKETPTTLILLLFAIAAAFGAYMGIESISRIHYLFLPIAGTVLVLFLIMLSPYYKTENLMPILGNGTKNLFLSGFKTTYLFSDIILLYILMPFSDTLYDIKHGGLKAIIISGAAAFFTLLSYCLIFPYPLSENFVFPVYQLTRMVHLSTFFNRFEAFFQFIWTIIILLYSSFYIYAMCFVLQHTFSLKYYKPMILPVVITLCSFSLLPESAQTVMAADKIVMLAVSIAVLLLPFIFGLMTKKGIQK